MENIVTRVKDQDAVIFHCMHSQVRGPACAAKLAKRLLREKDVSCQLYILEGGYCRFRNWTKKQIDTGKSIDVIEEFEEGYETRVGEWGTRLSGGQKQRIAIARVFLRKPKILFLDEATSALDAESESLVQEAIDKLIQTAGCTVVLVAHRLSTVVNADIIGVVHEGKIVEQGNHEFLVRQGGVYAKLVHKQIQKMANSLDADGSQNKKKQKAADTIDALLDE